MIEETTDYPTELLFESNAMEQEFFFYSFKY